jgi:hypothetical protein
MCTAFIFAGCQQAAPTKSATDVIKDGIKNLMEVTSASYNAKSSGNIDDKDSGNTKFDLTSSGIMDRKDMLTPQFSVKLDGTVSAGTTNGGSGSFDLRLNKDAFYFNVATLEMKGDQTILDQLKKYYAKWWKITIPPEAQKQLFAAVPPAGTQENLTPEQQQVKQLVEQTNFFANPTYVGTEDVNGEQSYHYSVTLDNKATIDFLLKMAEIQGTKPTADEITQVNTTFAQISATGDIYVGTVSGVLNKFNGTIKLDKAGPTETTGTITASMSLGSINKAVTLEIPAGAVEFPVEELFGTQQAAPTGTEQLSNTELQALGSTEQLSNAELQAIQASQELPAVPPYPAVQ